MKKIFTIMMTALLFVALAIPTFAAGPVGLPDLPTSYKHHIIAQQEDGVIRLYMFNNDNNATMHFTLDDDNILKISRNNGSSIVYEAVYHLDGTKWVLEMSGTLGGTQTTVIGPVKFFVSSDVDIVNSSGDVVFSGAPSISQILTGQVPNLVVKPMMETLKILVPFGVGLMVLFLSLPILRKVFYLFQVK